MTNNKYWRLGVGILSLPILSWLTLGLPVSDVFQITAITSLQTVLGALIWRTCFPLARKSIFSDIGLGFAIGSLLFVVIRQISNSLEINPLLPLGLAIVAIVISRMLRTTPARVGLLSTLRQPEVYPLPVVLTAFGSALVGARQFISQTRFTIALLLLVLGLALSLRRGGARRFGNWGQHLAISLTFVSLAYSLAYNHTSLPRMSRILQLFYSGSDDVLFSEALAFTVDRFGPYEQTFGELVSLKYHWLSLAWSGLMQNSVDLEPLAMSVLVAPAIGYIVVLSLLISCLEHIGFSISMPIFAAIAMFFLSSPGANLTTIFVENTSNIFGYVWLFAALKLTLLDAPPRQGPPWLRFMLLAVFAGATALAKAPYAVVLIVVVSARAIYSLLITRTTRMGLLIGETVAVCAGAFLTYSLFLRQQDWSPLRYEIGFRSLTHSHFPLTVGLSITVGLILLRLLPLCAIFRRFQLIDSAALYPMMLGVPVALSLDLVSNANSDTYFLNAALAIACLGLVPVFDASWTVLRDWRTSQSVLVVAIAFLVSFPIQLLGSTARFPSTIIPAVLFCLLVLSGLVILRRITKRIGSESYAPRPTPHMVIIFGVIVVLFLGIGGRAGEIGEIPLRTSMPSDEVFNAMRIIRDVTPHDAVIATNLGVCGLECLTHQYDRLVIPALAHRQTVNFWPRQSQIDLPDWQVQRTRSSFLFGVQPTEGHAKALTDLGATHYLVDLTIASYSCSTYGESSPSAVIFSDARWCLIEFDRQN